MSTEPGREPRRTVMSALALLAAGATLLPLARGAGAADLRVATAGELRAALAAVNPGDTVLVAPGDYTFTANLACNRPGAPGAPITVRAEVPGCARLLMDTVEGFLVSAPHWRFEDLDIQGTCADDSDCEHAFHVVGAADFTVIRRCRLHGFNAMVKGNGVDPGSGRNWPDDVLIEECELWNDAPRQTANPVTPIDVVGGRRWVVRRNFIHDFEKAGGDRVSYAAFLKGNGRDGRFEGNVVACAYLYAGGTRVGLSFGGGGSSPDPSARTGPAPSSTRAASWPTTSSSTAPTSASTSTRRSTARSTTTRSTTRPGSTCASRPRWWISATTSSPAASAPATAAR